MFSSWKQKLLLVFYVLILLSIPVGAYLASQNQNPNANASNPTPVKSALSDLKPLTSTPSASGGNLLDISPNEAGSAGQPSSTPSPEGAVSYGPTLSLKVALEGRPEGKMASSLFIGIAQGSVSESAPTYLLSFNINLPDSGEFSGLSLAGLNPGTTYSAVIKGPAQIATSSAFTMSAAESRLNNGQTVNLTTGDLNEDNVINTADYSIALAAYGSNANSSNWNSNADFNADGIVNTLDISLLLNNLSKTGQSGVWVSPPPPANSGETLGTPIEATPSASGPTQGYWFWMPKI